MNNISMNVDNERCILPKNNTSFLEKLCYHHIFVIPTEAKVTS